MSGLMGGLEGAPLPPSWRDATRMTYPFDLPAQRVIRMNYPLGWHLVGALAAAIVRSAGSAETAAPAAAAQTAAPATSATRPAARPIAIPRTQRAEMYYARRYGVDQLQVRSTASR
ncbi:MAG: hypothetical protein E6K47_07770 [Gammaproteobacteria bacterium]|nr:MAG: hypothetical protein E6K47_07770 [Gammaproteobacteria bacterium]